MKRVVNVFSSCFVFIGTIIGAGFASGRELVLYFGQCLGAIPLICILLFIMLYFVCFEYYKYGNKFGAYSKLGGGGKLDVVEIMVFCGYFIVAIAMTAGCKTVIAFAMNGYSSSVVGFFQLAFLIVAMLLSIKGIEGLKFANFILVPLILIVMGYLSIKTGAEDIGTEIVSFEFANRLKCMLNCFSWVSMNLFLASVVLIRLGRQMERRELFFSSLLGSGIVAVAVCIFLYGIKGRLDVLNCEMPMLEIARSLGNKGQALVSLIILGGIFTTIISCLLPLYDIVERMTGSKVVCFLIVTTSIYLCSSLGFSRITAIFYPLQSVFGMFLLARVFYRNRKECY